MRKALIMALVFLLLLPLVKADTYLTDCAVLDTPGETYYLTQDIINSSATTCMNIAADNIVLDCQGYIIDGTGASNSVAININNRNNVTVKNCILTEWYRPILVSASSVITIQNNSINCNSVASGINGIRLDNSNNNLIENNSISNCLYEIRAYNTNNTIIRYNVFDKDASLLSAAQINLVQYDNNISVINNTFYLKKYGVITGYDSVNITLKNNTMFLDNSRMQLGLLFWSNYPTTHDIDESNTINGKPIKYYKSESNIQPDVSNYAEVICANCSNVTFKNADLLGLMISFSNNITISNLTTITRNAIFVDHSINNEIYNSTFKSYGIALDLEYVNNTKIYNSVVESNWTPSAIYLEETYNNLFYNNLFNVSGVSFAGTNINYWNTTRQRGTRIYSAGTEIGGNYWTNPDGNGYSDTCTDADKDGFCDDPYVLATDNIDYLALSDEYSPPTTTTLPPVHGVPLLSSTLVGVVIGFGIITFMLRTLFDITMKGDPKKIIEYFIVLAVIVLTVLSLIALFA